MGDGSADSAGPDTDAVLAEWIGTDFRIEVASLARVAGGADAAAAVWCAVDGGGAAYAVKVSHGEMTSGLLASAHLAARGIRGVPAPLTANTGRPWSLRNGAQLSVTPWVVGRRGAEPPMDTGPWRAFGRLMAQVHVVDVPRELAAVLPVEHHRAAAASTVRSLDTRVRALAGHRSGDVDDLLRSLLDGWRTAADQIEVVTEQAEVLGRALRERPTPAVLTHGDAHAYNLLVEDDGSLRLLDWDAAMLAPRERDLMFVLGGVLADVPVSGSQRSAFFDGYGPVDVDATRLGYYQCLRALEDLGSWAGDVLDTQRHPRERADALAIFAGLLSPTGILEVALASLRRL